MKKNIMKPEERSHSFIKTNLRGSIGRGGKGCIGNTILGARGAHEKSQGVGGTGGVST